MDKIGLIAGNRKFPLVFAQAAKKKGKSIVAVAVRGETSPFLRKYVDKIRWVRLSEFSNLFTIFKEEGITEVVMAGQISPYRLFSKEVTRNKEIQDILASIKDKKANTIFAAIADKLKEHHIRLLDSTTYLEEFLPQKGVLTRKKPSSREWEDIEFGLRLAKEVAALDIGQTIAVKSKAIVAVEAFEGTDNLIRRAGRLVRQGLVIVKVSRPSQDMRFDIPVIGLATIKTCLRAGVSCLAIEAGKTLCIDQEAFVLLADKKSLAVVAA